MMRHPVADTPMEKDLKIRHRSDVRPLAAGFIAGVLLASGGVMPASVAAQSDEAEILGVVQALFDGIGSRDADLLERAMHPAGQLVAVPDEGGGDVARISTRDDFIGRITSGGPPLLERMWEPEVRIDGPIATVWAPYDFHNDGAFSHCGIDAAQLVKGADGWSILSVIYTLHPEPLCGPSPLGPPSGG